MKSYYSFIFFLFIIISLLFLRFKENKSRISTHMPDFKETLSNQLDGFCVSQRDAARRMANVRRGSVMVIWETKKRLSPFLDNIEHQDLQDIIGTFIMAKSNDTNANEYAKMYPRSKILSTDQCKESTIYDTVLSRGISHIHFLYLLNAYNNSEYVSSDVVNDLFQCHTVLLDVLSKLSNTSFDAHFHLHIATEDKITHVSQKRTQDLEYSRPCKITVDFNPEDMTHVTLRILEMISAVFHRLYGFRYYYVI